MKFQHIIEAVYFQPWSILPARWDAIHAVIQPHIQGKELPQIKADDGTDFDGNPMPKMEILPGGLAIIPVSGILMQHASLFDKMCGACSYDDIRRDLKEAASTGIKKVLLNINSPGGQCVGNQEACDEIAEARDNGMEVYAFGDTQICSAAYNLAASCDEIYTTRSTYVGSIGVLMAMIDRTEQFKQAGLKAELFASGKYKGAGTPGIPLNDDQREYFQSLTEKFAGMFKENVQSNRQEVTDETMQGQCFIGSDALDAGLVDEIVDDLDDVLELLS